jgi:hypothetical protein
MQEKNTAAKATDTVLLSVDSTFGNFDYTATVEVPQSVLIAGAKNGFVWEIQRSPAGKAEAVLTGFDGKTKVKPDGWHRTDIPFTTENAATLARELANRRNFAKGSFLPDNVKIVVKVTEHIATQAEPKYRSARNLIDGKLALKESLSDLAKTVGYKSGGKLDSTNEAFVQAVGLFMASR